LYLQPAHNDSEISRTEILFVDDDPLIVESLSIALGNQYKVISAANREQAKELVRKLAKVPSIALVDLGLPPLPHNPDEGYHLISELIMFNPNIKILVLSGQSDTTNIQHALTLGAVDSMTPVRPDKQWPFRPCQFLFESSNQVFPWVDYKDIFAVLVSGNTLESTVLNEKSLVVRCQQWGARCKTALKMHMANMFGGGAINTI